MARLINVLIKKKAELLEAEKLNSRICGYSDPTSVSLPKGPRAPCPNDAEWERQIDNLFSDRHKLTALISYNFNNESTDGGRTRKSTPESEMRNSVGFFLEYHGIKELIGLISFTADHMHIMNKLIQGNRLYDKFLNLLPAEVYRRCELSHQQEFMAIPLKKNYC
jgi:hypothetical protein